MTSGQRRAVPGSVPDAATGTGTGQSSGPPGLWLWRHPRPQAVAGRCIGRTDVAVDRRRAKRLAHRIRQAARRHGLPRVVWSSPLQRCADVGRWLARWGWCHRVDERLLELDFGAWDGRPWADIPWTEVQAWEADFAGHAPGGGESLLALLQRLRTWRAGLAGLPCLVVAHAGVVQALALDLGLRTDAADGAADGAADAANAANDANAADGADAADGAEPSLPAGLASSDWPRPPAYGRLTRLPLA